MQAQEPTIAELDRALHTMLDENDALRAEVVQLREENKCLVEWIMGDADALTTLQRTYLDPATSTSDRIKAAGAAIAYERPKLSISVSVSGPAVLGDRLDAAKTMKTVNPMLALPPVERQS
jgi:hypothetical protein